MKTDAYKGLRFLFRITLTLSFLLSINACKEDYIPKPKGNFRIGLPGTEYSTLKTDCPYSFDLNNEAKWVQKEDCWADVLYPSIRANIQLTYKNIEDENHFYRIVKESQDLAYKHSVKADGIGERFYENQEKRLYGVMYQMEGNAATSSQFFVTDSAHHFLRGVLYFYCAPNADSLKPVNSYMQDEMVHLIESLEWKNSLP